MLKQIAVTDLQPDETVDAVREARLLAKVTNSINVSIVTDVLVCYAVGSSLHCQVPR